MRLTRFGRRRADGADTPAADDPGPTSSAPDPADDDLGPTSSAPDPSDDDGPSADQSASLDDGTTPDGGRSPDDEALLATPLDDSDLNERLLAASGRSRARSTTVLVLVAVFAVGVAAGAAGGRTAADIAEAIAAQAGEEQDVQPADDPLVDGRLQGTVRVVDGDVLLIDAEGGVTVRVETTPTTHVATTVTTDLARLTPGAQVQITGELGPAGAVVATEIIETGRG